MFSTENLHQKQDISIGDFCYIVGLFRLLSGPRRNLPVVHTGHIALLPSDERMPVRDWLGAPSARRDVEGHLVETSNLQGLSGFPCFVRGTITIGGVPVNQE